MDAGIAPTGSFVPLPGYREITRRQQLGKPGPSGERGNGCALEQCGGFNADEPSDMTCA